MACRFAMHSQQRIAPALCTAIWAAPQQRSLHRLADHGEEADGREAPSYQGRASTPEASSHDRSRCLASSSGAGLLPIPCRSRQHASVAHLYPTRLSVVAERFGPPQSTRPGAMGSSHPFVEPLDSTPSRSAPLPDGPLCRSTSLVRAVCVNGLVRICAGGDQQWSSLLTTEELVCISAVVSRANGSHPVAEPTKS